MPAHITRGNRTRRAVRGLVEHVFAALERRFRFRIRSIGPARARAHIALVNRTRLVFRETRLAWAESARIPRMAPEGSAKRSRRDGRRAETHVSPPLPKPTISQASRSPSRWPQRGG